MLAGVGGRTVREAKANLTYDEFLSWREYIRTHGPINTGTHVDAAGALVAYVVAAVNGSKAKPDEFMPKYGPRQDDALKRAMREWK